MRAGLTAAWRRTGADLPGGDPRPSHGAEMEGYFWRFTSRGGPGGDRAVVALCGINRHRDGDWATVAVAAHPGGLVRSAVVPDAHAAPDRFEVRAGDVFAADAGSVRVRLTGLELDAALHETVPWTLRLGGGGLFSALPFLGQYWHPHVLGGRASLRLAGSGAPDVALDDAGVYAEKNWGAGFPDRWWWGEAHDFDGDDACVAFGGGRLRAGPLAIDVGGVVVRVGPTLVRFTPPLGRVTADVRDGRWSLRATRPGRWRVVVDGEGDEHQPHVLPVPVPAERRNVDQDLEHLAGHLRVTLWHRGVAVFAGTSTLAGLEVGARDAGEAADLARSLGVEAATR